MGVLKGRTIQIDRNLRRLRMGFGQEKSVTAGIEKREIHTSNSSLETS